MRLILASGSPRRAELLSAAGYAFEVRVPDIDEAPRRGELPHEYVTRLAAEKASAVFERLPEPGSHAVLGADTSVVLDGQILGKPADPEDGARMLRLLSNRAHEVITGVCLRREAGAVTHADLTRVTFAALDHAEIAWYVASGEGKDKAGGYAIQGLASRFIPRIDGSYSNVVGLPMATVARLLSLK